MKRIFIATLIAFTVISCQNSNTSNEVSAESTTVEKSYMSFGDSTFNVAGAITAAELVAQFNQGASDTLEATVAGPITKVCTTKGCWMATAIDKEENLFVDYDYAFLLPTNSQDQSMVMTGYAYWDSTSVAQLQHYAQDRGASEEEIAAITEPVGEVKFKATGVKIEIPTDVQE